MKSNLRTPKSYYDGTRVTTRRIADLLPQVLSAIGVMHNDRPDLVLTAWPEVIGQKLAGMTEAISFIDGILTIKVKNATLLSLLSQHDRPRILRNLQMKFPSVYFKNVVFRRG
ncbi:MAG: DUF721 domain-containing protein [Parachlamydiaceae bacterium]|nr:DUF721 domain-containing protein [Parachlamydiaceae bacterium]